MPSWGYARIAEEFVTLPMGMHRTLAAVQEGTCRCSTRTSTNSSSRIGCRCEYERVYTERVLGSPTRKSVLSRRLTFDVGQGLTGGRRCA